MEWKCILILSQLAIIAAWIIIFRYRNKRVDVILNVVAMLTGCVGVVVYFSDTPSLLEWGAICANIVLVITNVYCLRRNLVRK